MVSLGCALRGDYLRRYGGGEVVPPVGTIRFTRIGRGLTDLTLGKRAAMADKGGNNASATQPLTAAGGGFRPTLARTRVFLGVKCVNRSRVRAALFSGVESC